MKEKICQTKMEQAQTGKAPKQAEEKAIAKPKHLKPGKHYTKEGGEEFLKIYRENNCLVTKTCRKLGIHPNTVGRWAENDAEFAENKKLAEMEACENIEEHLIGNATGKKGQGIPVAQIYFLKNNHPKYAEQKTPIAEKMSFWWVKTVQPDIKQQIKEAKVIEGKVISDSTSRDLRTPKMAGTDNGKSASGDTRG